MTNVNLTPEELFERWNVPLATLSRWRWTGKGPKFMRLGKHIVYRLQDIERFEEAQVRRDTTCLIFNETFQNEDGIKKEEPPWANNNKKHL